MGGKVNKQEKSEAKARNQHHHNSSTRGCNSKKQGVLWSVRKMKVKDGDEEYTETMKTYVPPNTSWNPFDKSRFDKNAQEPFDALSLDWRKEIQHYAADNGAKVGSRKMANGLYEHAVIRGDDILFILESKEKLTFSRPRRRRRRKRKE